MENVTKCGLKIREKYKKRKELKLLRENQNLKSKIEKEKSKEEKKEQKVQKVDEKEKEKEPKKVKNDEIKKETDKESYISNREKTEEIIPENKILKCHKSINYFLSDSETTTRGDTWNDNNKKKFIYRKAINGKKFCFAINNVIPNLANQLKIERKNRLNYSMSLNKFLRENSSNDNILNTNHNFYRKQSNLLENHRTSHFDKNNNSLNLYNDKSKQFYEKGNNISCLYERNEEFINIEDLLNIGRKIY